MTKRTIYKILCWIALAFGIWYLVSFTDRIQFWTKNPALLSERPAYAMGELVGTPLLALFFFILWGWFGRKADPSGAMKKFWPWIYARLNKATHPANTVGCSDRDWLVIYAEGGTPFIVYKFTAVCVPLAWTGDSGSRGKYWPA